MVNVGVISDTHGLVRPEILEFLAGSELILHAGDVGSEDVLAQLAEVAPVVAIKGNVDKGAAVKDLPETKLVTVEGKRLYLLHNIKQLDFDPAAEKLDVIIYGHSHKPEKTLKDGVLYLNPGSVGPRRFSLPIAAARLQINAQGIDVALHNLSV